MKQYGIKFYEVEDCKEKEIEMKDIPNEYIFRLIKILQDEAIIRKRVNKACSRRMK